MFRIAFPEHVNSAVVDVRTSYVLPFVARAFEDSQSTFPTGEMGVLHESLFTVATYIRICFPLGWLESSSFSTSHTAVCHCFL